VKRIGPGRADDQEVTVMLDLVHPIRTGWRLGSTGRHAGVDEAVGANNEHVRQIAARHPGGESFAGDPGLSMPSLPWSSTTLQAVTAPVHRFNL
jgi:hypothetical protein